MLQTSCYHSNHLEGERGKGDPYCSMQGKEKESVFLQNNHQLYYLGRRLCVSDGDGDVNKQFF